MRSGVRFATSMIIMPVVGHTEECKVASALVEAEIGLRDNHANQFVE